MIPCFQSYNDFINHLNSHYISYRQLFDFSLLNDDFQSAFFKMIWLDVDNTFDILRPLYSNTGRPAKNQIQFLRSFILMAHFKYFSIKKWVKRLKKQNALAVICGFDPLDVPSFSSHYDFIHRLFLKKKYTHDDFVCENKPYKNIDTKSKPKNGSKLVNFNMSATDELLHVFTDNSNPVDELEEKILLQLFNVLAPISVSTIILSKTILPFLVMVPVYIPMLPNMVLNLTIITDVILILMPISVGIKISILFTMVILPIL
ncbi:MAG: transposase [Faecalibacillus faecis]|uniref:transposase n=1 Tax=Faecalibacillus faecis TaxID=1982628 RepID=UPI003992ED54